MYPLENKIARDIFVRFLLESRTLEVDCAETQCHEAHEVVPVGDRAGSPNGGSRMCLSPPVSPPIAVQASPLSPGRYPDITL